MSDDYEIGYKRPPQANRFKKGQSGNPRGRPKGARNLKTDLTEELQSRVPIILQGKKKMITKQRAMIMGLLSRAIKGDPRATSTVLNTMKQILPEIEPDDQEGNLPSADQEIVDAFLQRNRNSKPDGRPK